MNAQALLAPVIDALGAGEVVPYLGPGALPEGASVPREPAALAAALAAKVSVPFKLKANLPGAAQYIENFKHRKTLTALTADACAATPEPGALHAWLARLPAVPLVVHAWYDATLAHALAARESWGAVQGVSQAEHHGMWTRFYSASGAPTLPAAARDWATLVYQPIGSVWPARNFVVSDSDFVEVLTEIDIQTPIPAEVQARRAGKSFLFLGCRFNDQLSRGFARQIMKRSSDRHWAVLPGEPTRNEARFLVEQGIERLDLPLETFTALLTAAERDQSHSLAAGT